MTRWTLYFLTGLIPGMVVFGVIFSAGDVMDVCDAVGKPGEYGVSFDDWSCDLSYGVAAIHILWVALPITVFVATGAEIIRLARWGPDEKPRHLFRRR